MLLPSEACICDQQRGCSTPPTTGRLRMLLVQYRPVIGVRPVLRQFDLIRGQIENTEKAQDPEEREPVRDDH